MTLVEYLSEGGLIGLLRRNISGGKDQPAIWLIPTPEGGFEQRLSFEEGAIGGKQVPFYAVADGRIIRTKLEDVYSYLQSFGLSKPESEQVVNAIGIEAPQGVKTAR